MLAKKSAGLFFVATEKGPSAVRLQFIRVGGNCPRNSHTVAPNLLNLQCRKKPRAAGIEMGEKRCAGRVGTLKLGQMQQPCPGDAPKLLPSGPSAPGFQPANAFRYALSKR